MTDELTAALEAAEAKRAQLQRALDEKRDQERRARESYEAQRDAFEVKTEAAREQLRSLQADRERLTREQEALIAVPSKGRVAWEVIGRPALWGAALLAGLTEVSFARPHLIGLGVLIGSVIAGRFAWNVWRRLRG